MSQQQLISRADLSYINNALGSLNNNVSAIYSELDNIHSKQDILEVELQKFSDAFADFVESDIKMKALQLAETKQGNLKQDLQIKFGHNAEVRRMAVGILQGVDTGIISEETLRFTTEEVMIKAQGYWLAPALVTLASWIRNDKDNVNKALKECLNRDDYKATLFFMLVMRRLNRSDASLNWLERYFRHLNPHNIDREFLIILEAVTTGVFLPASRSMLTETLKQWLEQLTKSDNYINDQKTQWIKLFEAKGPSPEKNYPLLEKYATNWQELEHSMKEVRTHGVLKEFFKTIFTSSVDFSKAVKVQLDEILSLLVTNFDDDELPLQQQIRLNQLIIEMDGDKKAAQAVMDTEVHIFEEKVNFLQLLTNVSFNPELAGVSKNTQALAVSISQPWILEAHDTFTANVRNKVPKVIELDIDTFQTSTKDGSDEKEQLAKHEVYWDNIIRAELRNVSFPFIQFIIGAFLILGSFQGFMANVFLALSMMGIGGVLIWTSFTKFKKRKAQALRLVEERKSKSREVLRGCLAEAVDYRRQHSKEDARAEEVGHLLASISPEDFSSISKETKNIL